MGIDGELRPIFRNRLRRGIHWQSVETGGTGLGIPDSNLCMTEGREGWMEFKQTEAWSVGLSTEQVGWHLRRCAMGGRTWIAVRRWHTGGPKKGPPVDELWLYRGDAASVLRSEGLKTDDGLLGRWHGGPARWDWDAVRGTLETSWSDRWGRSEG